MITSSEIKTLIEEVVNPQLEGHGGCCLFKSFENGVVTVELAGGCKGCPGRQRTFLNGIKPFLLENCEGVKDVVLA
jgi:Fe-S cluster biogenesis protein NfuA